MGHIAKRNWIERPLKAFHSLATIDLMILLLKAENQMSSKVLEVRVRASPRRRNDSSQCQEGTQMGNRVES